ncbi:MAG: hypothetical protein KA028_00345 [Candidatus Pacebacteria bacterium]|nr:hypothetical protein [Candidatus Paceibacterota bacterium]MBP9851954.1 hypothetical protein [Candidatus Paceibacterota bacterium]
MEENNPQVLNNQKPSAKNAGMRIVVGFVLFILGWGSVVGAFSGNGDLGALKLYGGMLIGLIGGIVMLIGFIRLAKAAKK